MTPEAPDRGPLIEQTDERSARADWRSSTVGSILVTLITGIWLVVSPAVISYDRPAIPILWGALIALLSLLRLLASTTSRALALTTAAAGALAAISAFLSEEAPGPTANLALFGAAVVVLATITVAVAAEGSRQSRA